MIRSVNALWGLLFSATAAVAQQPNLQYRTVLQSGQAIGTYTPSMDATINTFALNDNGDWACILTDYADGANRAGLVTSKGLVVRAGDVIEGRYIVQVSNDTPPILNKAGHVLYRAFFSTNKQTADAGIFVLGLFVESHFVMNVNQQERGVDYLLGDGDMPIMKTDQFYTAPQPVSPACNPSKNINPGHWFGRLINKGSTTAERWTGIPMPNSSDIAQEAQKNCPPAKQQPEPLHQLGTLNLGPLKIGNARGQILMAAKLQPRGVALLLGTPAR
jgi:hypothetical protein